MSINDYIAKFDEEFNTNISETINDNTYPMLDFALSELGEMLYTINDNSRIISENKAKIIAKLDEHLTREQKLLLDDYLELDSELLTDVERQLLIFGFCLCYEQLREMNALKI